jgi:hypothetical protein
MPSSASAAACGGGELDEGPVPVRGELPGVFEQVLQHGADKAAVRGDPDAVRDDETDLAARVTGRSSPAMAATSALRSTGPRFTPARETCDSSSRSSIRAAIRSLAA